MYMVGINVIKIMSRKSTLVLWYPSAKLNNSKL